MEQYKTLLRELTDCIRAKISGNEIWLYGSKTDYERNFEPPNGYKFFGGWLYYWGLSGWIQAEKT